MRCNVGIPPSVLADQHLVAESVELKMVPGLMRHRIRVGSRQSAPPTSFTLGKGHMLFFTNKLKYLSRRLEEVNKEMRARGFSPGMPDYIDSKEFGDKARHDWSPTSKDSQLVKDRITEKVNRKNDGFWRFHRQPVTNKQIVDQVQTDGPPYFC